MDPATVIDAVFTGGQFRPVDEVDLPENTRVRLTVTPQPPPHHLDELMARLNAHRQELFEKYGYFTDTTEIIAADRRRDE